MQTLRALLNGEAIRHRGEFDNLEVESHSYARVRPNARTLSVSAVS